MVSSGPRISAAARRFVARRSLSGARASGAVLMTLEDETGIATIVAWPKVMAQFRKEVMPTQT
jgi:error-prone DNA polymerase